MIATATDGRHWDALIAMVRPIFQAAQLTQPTRRGAPQVYTDWQVAAMVLIAVLARRKSTSAQSRYLSDRRDQVAGLLGLGRWPSRTTYF